MTPEAAVAELHAYADRLRRLVADDDLSWDLDEQTAKKLCAGVELLTSSLATALREVRVVKDGSSVTTTRRSTPLGTAATGLLRVSRELTQARTRDTPPSTG